MSEFKRIRCYSDWGRIYYAFEGEGLSSYGTASVNRGLKLREGQRVFLGVDAGPGYYTLSRRTHREEVNDHGHSSIVVSDEFGVEIHCDECGHTRWVPLENCSARPEDLK